MIRLMILQGLAMESTSATKPKVAEKNIQSPALSNTFPTSSSSSLSPSPSSIPITSNMASEPSIIVPPTVSISSALLKDNALAFSTVRNTLQAMTQVIHTKQQQVQQQQQQEQLELTLLTALDDAVSYTIDTNDLSPDHTTMSMMGTIQQIESTIQFKTTMIQESSLPTSTATTPLPLPISINNTHHDNQTDIEEVVINTTDLDSLSLLTSTISSQETIPNINPLHSSSSSSSSSSSMRTVSKPSSIDEELSHYTQLLEEAVLIQQHENSHLNWTRSYNFITISINHDFIFSLWFTICTNFYTITRMNIYLSASCNKKWNIRKIIIPPTGM
jgi:hypothetical protein